ncbi:MAG: hypothetical protein WC979_00210 [Candidatus Pacearchaeota archaeon]|jgi:glutaredoxin-related protein|nr:hypothetical protein [Clostridia bacterium]
MEELLEKLNARLQYLELMEGMQNLKEIDRLQFGAAAHEVKLMIVEVQSQFLKELNVKS